MTGGPSDWVKVAVAGNEYEAHLMAGRLEEEGIKVVLDPYATGVAAYLQAGSDPNAPVRILVPWDREDDAVEVLAVIDAESSVAGAEETTVEEPGGPNDVFAERRAGVPFMVLVVAAVVVAIILGLSVSDGLLDL